MDDHQWANKDVLLAQTGLALLTQPIQDHLDALKCQLEDRLGTVNQRISAGENSHLHITTTGKRKSWTLQYPTSNEPSNHPIFETLRQVNISRVLHGCRITTANSWRASSMFWDGTANKLPMIAF